MADRIRPTEPRHDLRAPARSREPRLLGRSTRRSTSAPSTESRASTRSTTSTKAARRASPTAATATPTPTCWRARSPSLRVRRTALVCATGMASEAALFLSTLSAGDEVALSDNLYGKTVVLVGRELSRFGDRVIASSTRPGPRRSARSCSSRTRLVFVETLSNPLVRLADIAGLAEVAHAAGAVLAVDHTFAPLLCRPIALGADYVTHSLTKLIGGHSDLILGLLAGSREGIARATGVASAFGLVGNPFESWLALRGLATLALRSARACANALDLAERLEDHPSVRAVHYPGLASHPDHARARKTLCGGFGTIATIDLGGRAEADRFIRGLKTIPFAPSLGDVATTLSHPATTSHRNQTAEQWARQGISPGLIRLSFGIEDPDDLWSDMARALKLRIAASFPGREVRARTPGLKADRSRPGVQGWQRQMRLTPRQPPRNTPYFLNAPIM